MYVLLVYHHSNKHSSDKINIMNMYSVLIDQAQAKYEKAIERLDYVDKEMGIKPSELSSQLEHNIKEKIVVMNSLKRLIDIKQILTDSEKAYILDVMASVEALRRSASKREEELSEAMGYECHEEIGSPSSMY
jgi:uncharacterized protein (DUF1015 family)